MKNRGASPDKSCQQRARGGWHLLAEGQAEHGRSEGSIEGATCAQMHETQTSLGLSSWLYKLGGGKSEGSRWNRRFFVLDGSVLQYYKSELALQRPNGAVQIGLCIVTARDESAASDGSLRWGFALVHPCGDTLVLATETKAERALWMEALQAQPSSPNVGSVDGAARGAAGAWTAETEASRAAEAAAAAPLETPATIAAVEARRGEAEDALAAEDAALCAARASLQSAVAASERADAQLRRVRGRAAEVGPTQKSTSAALRMT